jgi:catechol 2,3-dioxygenase-like lactoylglutathione lyase family enzyme
MTGARVRDLDASIRFYGEVMGFPLIERDAEADVAVVSFNGYPVLLAGPAAGDLTPHLNRVHGVVQPGGTLFAYAADIDAEQTRLASRAAPQLTRIEKPWGDRILTVVDPDGYTISFWTNPQRTPEETLTLYAAGVGALETALAGLSEEDHDLRPGPGEWSIRQIVHHLADSEATALAQPKFALAEPGRRYSGNRYDSDTWAQGLMYDNRAIAPSVALFAAIRGHMAQLLRTLPGARERATVDPAGNERPACIVIGMLASHAYEHIESIQDIRRLHGK